jgi:invasion protein IalB
VKRSSILPAIIGFSLFLAGAGTVLGQGIPGGASSLSEAHGDWTVSCKAPEGVAKCAISQIQVQGENRQRVLAMELSTTADGRAANGTLVLPFGLRLDDGITLSLDEAEPFQSLRFSTCLPAGCLVPLGFGADLVSALGSKTSLAIAASANETGEKVAFSVSLKGFSSALARVAQLTAP